jgi:hypothetical protein
MNDHDWVVRAVQLEREFGHELDWFDRPTLVAPPPQSSVEDTTILDIYRAVAVLALAWHVPPQTVLFFLTAEAPDKAAWGGLVSGSWDRLPASQRASLNGLAAEEKAA